MVTKQDNQPESGEVTETVQRTAIEIKLLNTSDLLKSAAAAISANVAKAREDDEKGKAVVLPTTALVTNLGIWDDPGKSTNPAIEYVTARLHEMDIPVNVGEYLEMAHLIANAMKAPDLNNQVDPEIKGEADKLRDILKAVEYLDAAEDVVNVAKLAIGAYDASVNSLHQWVGKGKSTKTGNSPGPSSLPANRDMVDSVRKLRATDKVRETTGWDVEYVCGDHRTTHGDALSSTKHYIRAMYREANNLDETAATAGTPEWDALGEAITNALTSDSPVEWGNGYIHRVAPGS